MGTEVWQQQVLSQARTWIGTPYRHQASCKGAGTDCLGLIRGLYRELYGREPEKPPAYSPLWAELSSRASRELMLQAAERHLVPRDIEGVCPGDVLLFRLSPHHPVKHAAILSEEGRMIHAYAGQSVLETAFVPWWQKRLAAVFAFPPIKRQ